MPFTLKAAGKLLFRVRFEWCSLCTVRCVNPRCGPCRAVSAVGFLATLCNCVSPPSLRLAAVTDAPNGGLPPNCNGFQQFNVSGSSSISISDGSAKGMKYSNNSECYWSVSAPQGNRVELTFEYFDLEEGYDTLTVSLGYR